MHRNLCMDMPQLLNIALIFFAVLTCSASLVFWSLAFLQFKSGEKILPFEARRHVPWGLLDILISIVLFVVVSVVLLFTLEMALGFSFDGSQEPLLTSEDLIERTVLGSGSFAILMICIIILLKLRVRATWYDLGFNFNQIFVDLKLGIIAFVMLAPPMYFITSQVNKLIEYDHLIVELLQQASTFQNLVITAIATMIIAPITEEFFFRVIFQGWLENAHNLWNDRFSILYGPIDSQFDEQAENNPENIDAEIEDPQESHDSNADLSAQPAKWPIYVSAAVFAMMHYGDGLAPIPLFFLALGLGYLYQTTHRIMPCIIVHGLVNSTSMILLWIELSKSKQTDLAGNILTFFP